VKRHCATCGIAIRWRSDGVCHRCHKVYVQEDGTYPDWLMFLVRDINKEDKAEERRLPIVSSYGLLEDLNTDDEFKSSYFN
jgi:hypothetical protein